MPGINKKDFIKISIPNKPEYVSLARLTASVIASKAGFNVEEIDDIKVAIGEACTNAIQHVNKEENQNYEIEFTVFNKELLISVKDTGMNSCNLDIKEPNVGELKEGGLGLFIIKTLMDEVECINREGIGTEIRMIKRIGV